MFFKFDIEPILLLIRHERPSLLRLLVRLVNVVSGVLVAGGWTYQLFGASDAVVVSALLPGWMKNRWGGRVGGRGGGKGVLDSGVAHDD